MADTTTTTNPWAGAQPYIEKGFSEAAGIYDNYSPQYYGGQTQASFSPDQLAAQAGARDWALQGSPGIMNPAISAYQQGTNANMLDVANNPYVQNMAQQASVDAYGGLAPQFANIRQGAVQSGGYGGSRQGIAEGIAISGAADAANRASAGIYSNAYGQGLQHQLGTLGQTESIINSGFQPYTALNQAGAQQTGREQALIEDARAQYEFNQNLPYTRLDQYNTGLSGAAGLMGTGVGSVTGPQPAGQSNTSKAADYLKLGGAAVGLYDDISNFL